MSFALLERPDPSASPAATQTKPAQLQFRASKSLLIGITASLTVAGHVALLASLRLVHIHPLWAVGLSPNNFVLWECRRASLVWIVTLAVLSMSVASPIHYMLGRRSLEPRTKSTSRSKRAWQWFVRRKVIQAFSAWLWRQSALRTGWVWFWWAQAPIRSLFEKNRRLQSRLREQLDSIMARKHFQLWGLFLVLVCPNTGMLILAGTYKLPRVKVALASLIGRVARVIGVLYFYYGPLIAQITGWTIFPLALAIPAIPTVTRRLKSRLNRSCRSIQQTGSNPATVPGAAR